MTEATPKLKLERVFDATPEQVWAAWTDPKQYAKWLNPAPGLDLVIHEFDVRPGGKMRFDMPQPDGNPHPQEGVFHELDAPRRLVSGSEDRSFLLDVTIEPVGRRTRLVVLATGVPPDWHAAATQGWNAGFDKLDRVLGEGRDIVLTRVVKAPRERVYAAWTDPKQVDAWWGPDGHVTTTKEMRVAPGGVWRFDMRGPDGTVWNNRIEYHEVAPPSRLAYVHGGDDEPAQFLVLVTLAAEDDATRVTMRSRFPSAEALAKVRAFGAEELGAQTLRRLADRVESA